MGKFAKSLKASGVKTNNHTAALKAKTMIRLNVLDVIGAEHARVFDAFAGDGAMWRAAWKDAEAYAGCDVKWYPDERLAYVADNRRVLRAIDLKPFNIVDLDAWGSPWEQALILCDRRGPLEPGERFGLVITEGSGLKLKMGGYPVALRLLAGLRGSPAGGAGSHSELIDRCLSGICRRMKAAPLKRWEAKGKSGASVHYVGLVLEGIGIRQAPGWRESPCKAGRQAVRPLCRAGP